MFLPTSPMLPSGSSTPRSTHTPPSTEPLKDDSAPIDPQTIDTITTLSKKTQGSINRIQDSFDAIETHMSHVHSYDSIRRLQTTESNIDALLLATERLLQAKAKARDDEKRRTRNFAFEDEDFLVDFTVDAVPKIGAGVTGQHEAREEKATLISPAVRKGEGKKLVKKKPKAKDTGKGKGKEKVGKVVDQEVRTPVRPAATTARTNREREETKKMPVDWAKPPKKEEQTVLPASRERLPKNDQGQSARKDGGQGKENEDSTQRTRKLSEDVLKASRRVTRWPTMEDYPEWKT